MTQNLRFGVPKLRFAGRPKLAADFEKRHVFGCCFETSVSLKNGVRIPKNDTRFCAATEKHKRIFGSDFVPFFLGMLLV